MPRDWYELTRLTRGAPFAVERVRLLDSDITIEGSFDLPALARLSAEDHVFVMAFVRSHGSIKEMEQIFGISYPTVKNRLNRLVEQLHLVETVPTQSQADVLTQLADGEINADEAIKRMAE